MKGMRDSINSAIYSLVNYSISWLDITQGPNGGCGMRMKNVIHCNYSDHGHFHAPLPNIE